MTYSRRIAGIVTALVVTLISTTASPLMAQNAKPILIDGSGIMAPVLKADANGYATKNSSVSVQVNVSGTDGGLDKLCKGQIDIAMANRAIRDTESNDCGSRNVKYVELVVGYDALMVVVNPKAQADCIVPSMLPRLLGPSAKGINNWSSVTTVSSTPVAGQTAPTPVVDPLGKVYAVFDSTAPDKSPVRILADSVMGGTGLRDDLTAVDSPSKVIDAVKADPTAAGILTLADFQNTAGTAVRALKLQGSAGCVDVSKPINLSEQRYPALEVLYLYVNADALSRGEVADYLNYTLGSDGQANLINSGFATADTGTYTTGVSYITGKRTGRTFSRILSVQVSTDTNGTVEIDGSPVFNNIFSTVSSNFSNVYKAIKVNVNTYGNDAGFTKLCAGTADLIGTTRLFSDSDSAACQKANIKTLQLPIGSQGVVLLVNPKNTWATCLTTDAIAKLLISTSTKTVMKWSDVKSDFPQKDLLIITPTDGSSTTDLLLNKALPKQVAPTRRTDTSESDDPAYRATATGINDTAITYMTFSEYQKLNATNLTLVSVDNGKGCIKPSGATLADGSYVFSDALYLIYNLKVFSRPDMKAFVWYSLSDDTIKALSDGGLVGTDTTKFLAARDTALNMFTPGIAPAPSGTASADATGAATLAVNPPSLATAVPTQAATTSK
jgi:phosphate transport system substrate-binding protein